MECRSREDAGGGRREEVRGVKDGRCGAWTEGVVEGRGMESCAGILEVEAAVVERVDEEERLECAVRNVEVESVEAMDALSASACVCTPRDSGERVVGCGGELKSSSSNSEDAMLRACISYVVQLPELNSVVA
jgi:hypothetical protein